MDGGLKDTTLLQVGLCRKNGTFTNQDLQDDIDAETIYNMLEYEIVPAYYSLNQQGFSSSG
jgi:hypothetical protein